MAENKSRKQQASLLRSFRKIHRITGALLFVFFFIVSISGVLLGWKKHSGNIILPKSYKGITTDLKNWMPVDSLQTIACNVLHDSVSSNLSLEIERIDIRKDKGMVKFVFSNHLWEIQLDGATGKLLHIGKRHSDLIENIHDGSVLDDFTGTENGQLKLIYSSIMGLSLLAFTITGFWLWYGPKRMRKNKKRNVGK